MERHPALADRDIAARPGPIGILEGEEGPGPARAVRVGSGLR